MKRLVLVALAACGSDPPGQGTNPYMCMSDGGVNGSRISVSNSGACSRGDITNGKATKNEGEPCTNSSECKQICCSCSPRSTKSSSVLLCTDGKCATKEQACCDLLTSLSCAP